ncbi:hypothetical protein NDU88_005437 [Pleurodeles waltl]|uniref:Uncharacterized protein n=1 Tax=Pleurodeles waltl TaxID=8319 RepID=A0AAV7WDD6_PLEWA|nr:hypothetical protein NDU88_005437 [Pleurodeles waltl]
MVREVRPCRGPAQWTGDLRCRSGRGPDSWSPPGSGTERRRGSPAADWHGGCSPRQGAGQNMWSNSNLPGSGSGSRRSRPIQRASRSKLQLEYWLRRCGDLSLGGPEVGSKLSTADGRFFVGRLFPSWSRRWWVGGFSRAGNRSCGTSEAETWACVSPKPAERGILPAGLGTRLISWNGDLGPWQSLAGSEGSLPVGPEKRSTSKVGRVLGNS